MYSLFSKIFLSFWLVALLLGAVFFTAERYLGGSAIDSAVERVEAHAETVSGLLADEGMPAVRRWLVRMGRSERMPLLLLNEQGLPIGAQRLPSRLQGSMDRPLAPGVHQLRPRLLAVVRLIPETSPPLHLAALVHLDPNQRNLSPAALLGFAVLLSGLVALALAALITRPVRRLRRAAQALATGDLAVRVPESGRDEVAALARDFNLMANRVRDLLDAQRRLLRDVSHELRSPLARLRVALELAHRNGDTATAFTRIEREADRLETLVTDVLSLARLEAGQTRLQKQSLDLGELVRAVAQDSAFEAEAMHKRVRLEMKDGAMLDADPVLLRAAVENVVRNAVRHTAADSEVEITLNREGTDMVITICDRGEGVPEGELNTLFEPFTRVGEARERDRGGYGLGLAISRQAVEAHGGRIGAVNREGGGLCVTLRLPG